MPFPDHLTTKPKLIMFTDFDGTITPKDSNKFLIRKVGAGDELAQRLKKQVVEGQMSFRDAYKTLLDSITTPLPECIDLVLSNIEVDPAFSSFYYWARRRNIPVVILSGGMRPIIRALLSKALGPDADNIELVCNDIVAREGMNNNERGGWQIQFRDESKDGNDKAAFIKPYAKYAATRRPRERPILLYAGDGISDFAGAKETDVLFAKAGEELADYCVREKVNFVPFDSWQQILAVTRSIFDERTYPRERPGSMTSLDRWRREELIVGST